MPTPSPTLSLSGISKRYTDGRTALDGFSVEVGPGTITGLIGLNGAGKTTAIRITAGLLEADAGVVAFEGVPRMPGHDGWKSIRGFVLDEPPEGIDALTAGILCDALRRMAARGVAVLISSHILDMLERLSDRIAILHDGRLVLESAAPEIRTKVQRAGSTVSSLEDLFLDAVGGHARRRHLSW